MVERLTLQFQSYLPVLHRVISLYTTFNPILVKLSWSVLKFYKLAFIHYSNCNKNVDIKFSVHVSRIIFIGYAQNRKPNNLNAWEQYKPKGLNRLAKIG